MRRLRWVVVSVVVALVLVLPGAGYMWFRVNLSRALPRVSGEIAVEGAREKVEILRDTFGVPHIYAGNEPDLFFALGFAMAQDRLWQMELLRRTGQGRLSEVFGGNFVRTDQHFRSLRATTGEKEVAREVSHLLGSFTDGINVYMETHRDRLPVEFTLAGFRPEPWKPGDHAAILLVIDWGLSIGWRVDMTAARVLGRVGEQKAREAFPEWPEEAPVIVAESSGLLSGASRRLDEVARTVRGVTGLPVPAASNNWVVSGKKSSTGKPLLANDPHLMLSNPSFWWEVHLSCPTIDASGVALPGTPGIAIGQNRSAAWGVTSAMVDDIDFYIEILNPDNPRQYWYEGRWEDMRVLEETIPVKGEDPVTVEILLTRHGPIVERGHGEAGEEAVAARWTHADALKPELAVYRLLTARNINEIRDALRDWEVPGLNFVFADADGGIGYWCCAPIPIRNRAGGMLPLFGWTREYEWQGYVPFDEKPHLMNPAQEFIATANNRIAGREYKHHLGNYWEPADRITRIHQMLSDEERFSREDFARMQQDVFSVSASVIAPRMAEALQKPIPGGDAERVRGILSGWDFRVERDSTAACIFEVAYRKMMDNIFKDELGEELYLEYLESTIFPPRAVLQMVQNGASPWFDDVSTPAAETMEDVLHKSLTQALAELEETAGADMDGWLWGRIHSVTFEHALGKKRPLDRIFNLGPYPIGGSGLTVSKEKYSYENPYRVNHGVSMRMIADLSDINGSLRVLPTGESGHLGSPHYKDQLELYLGGGYHPVWMDRNEVEKHTREILILTHKQGRGSTKEKED